MKKKSLLLAVIAFTSLGLVGCDGTKTSGTVKDSTSQSQFLEDDSNITLRGATTFEVNQTITYRFSVANAVRNKLVKVSLEANDVAGILQTDGTVDYEANGVSSVKVFGVSEGTIKRKVTSVETGNSKTFTLTVTAAKPTLQETLNSLASATNYTFIGKPEDESLQNKLTTTITKRVEKALTVTDGEGVNLWQAKATDDGEAASYARYGIAVNSEGKAFYIDKNITMDKDGNTTTDENFRSSAIYAVSPSIGFLNQDNFAGDPDAFNGYLFNSFALISGSWATSEKADDNIYTIEGGTSDSDESSSAAILECRLWNMVDPSGMISNRQVKNIFTYADAASWIDTTVEVIDLNNIKVTITPVANSGLKRVVSAEDKTSADYPTMVGEVSNFGNTTLDTEIRNYLGTKITFQNPGMNSAKKQINSALHSNNFTFVEPISYDYGTKDKDGNYSDSGTVYRYWYYTENYLFFEIPQASYDQYKKDTGKETITYEGSDGKEHELESNIGYGLTKDKKLHELTYNAAADGKPASVSVGEAVTSQGQTITLNSRNEFSPSGIGIEGGLGALIDTTGSIYMLSDKATTFWKGDNKLYYNNYRKMNPNCYDPFALYFLGFTGDNIINAFVEKYPAAKNNVQFFTLLNVETATDDTVTAINFQLDARFPDGKYYRGSMFEFSVKDFGTTKSSYDTLITEALAA